MTHDAIYLREACKVGRMDSQDPHTQNGALLRAHSGEIVVAANRLPPEVVVSEARLARPAKYQFVEHAERGAIFAAAKAGIATHNATLYCPWFACADCARAIILAGITRAVGHSVPRSHANGRWADSIAAADQMLREAGVRMELLDEPLGVSYLFNGSIIEF
jgi:dCMP deaminase